MTEIKQRGKYFEELIPGDEYVTVSRTLFQTDINSYAGLTGDWNPMHTDAEFAGQSQFGQIIAHGPLVFAMANGLIARLGIFDETAIAYLEAFHKCTLPTFVGNTIHLRIKVIDRKESAKKDRGIVSFKIEVVNQKDEVVQYQDWKMLMKRKPE